MKVTPVKRKFGKFEPEIHAFDFPNEAAKILIKAKRLREITEEEPLKGLQYQTRMMQAAPIAVPSNASEHAPYGFKSDGTPRQRPGRPAKSEE